MQIKKCKKYIFCLIVAVLLELFVFNFSSIKSLSNSPVDLTDKIYCEGTTAYINDVGFKVNNIYIDASPKENIPLTYSLFISDEGNYYSYKLGDGYIASKSPSSAYRSVYSYGVTKSLSIEFPEDNQPNFSNLRIIANAKVPMFFSLLRMIIVFIILCFVVGIKNDNTVKLIFDKSDKDYKKQAIVIGLVILLTIAWGYYWSSAHVLFNEATKPHHQQYKELARTLKQGEVALPIEPSEGLINAPNPYDTIYLQANGIEYMADYAFYNDRYYVYFGIVPELLIYYPYHLVTGKDFPNHAAVFLFYALYAVGVFLLLREFAAKYFKEVSLCAYLMIAIATTVCAPVAYLYFTADLYSVPIMAAFGLTAIGLFFWTKSQNIESKKLEAVFIALGSLSMALVAGCRPQMLIFSFLALPIFWDMVFEKRLLFSKKSIINTIALALPYLIVAILVMAYNYLRFGSVFDFGATYSLTNNDMNLRGISASRMTLGLITFLFEPPYINGIFPFLHSVSLKFEHMGKIVTEHYFGGVIACNMLTWPLVLIYTVKNNTKDKLIKIIITMLIAFSIILGILDANAAGVLQRYCSEMSFGILIASAITMLLFINEKNNSTVFTFLKVGFIAEIVFAIMTIFNTDAGITLIQYNPELFYKIAEMFRF